MLFVVYTYFVQSFFSCQIKYVKKKILRIAAMAVLKIPKLWNRIELKLCSQLAFGKLISKIIDSALSITLGVCKVCNNVSFVHLWKNIIIFLKDTFVKMKASYNFTPGRSYVSVPTFWNVMSYYCHYSNLKKRLSSDSP